MSKLKPCPFCGNEAVRFSGVYFEKEMHYIQCTNEDCLIQPITGMYTLKSNATKAWNKRC